MKKTIDMSLKNIFKAKNYSTPISFKLVNFWA